MNVAYSLPSSVTGISFSLLSTQDVRRISVKQIVNTVLLDDLNRPNIGGLYDPALGPSDHQDLCATCHLHYFTCPGHFGHIELPAPVFHPLFIPNMYNLLRGTCLFCHRFKLSRSVLCKYIAKFRLLERGLLDAAQGVDDIQRRCRKTKSKPSAKDDGDSDLGEDGQPDETIEQFQTRINLFAHIHLSRATTSKRDHYKDGLVYQTRKDLITTFLKSTILKTCQNEGCGAPAYTFRKEGYTKIIEYDLSKKQKGQLMGQRRPDVLLAQKGDRVHSHGLEEDEDEEASDDNMSEPESVSESVGMLDEEAVDEDERRQDSRRDEPLPRTASGKIKTKRGRNERAMSPEECRAHLRRLFRNEVAMCSLLYGRHGPFAPLSRDGFSHASADMFFLEVIPVAPTRFRPAAKLGETLFEHPQNELLAKVLRTSYRLRNLHLELRSATDKDADVSAVTLKTLQGRLLESLIQLQVDVNSFMDSNKNPAPVRQGKLPPAGVKQGLEKKEGLFRKHMMGKRVNYAARSVISPDVNIEPNEIGIPPVFAKKLTYPEPVTPANFHELRQLVITGPRGYPGATMVEYEDGHQQSLDNLTVEQRTAVANQLLTPQDGNRASTSARYALHTRTTSVNKKVYRHLLEGDLLILNRQPTLHKPSMMTHKARVLQGEKTIRLHYANCKSYNADFDGDEMNIHFPQNQVARAEAMFIANTDNQYLVPTSGKPLRGLIQDHVVAGVRMTSQDSFFTREEYFQLLYGALRPEEDSHHSGRLVTLPPTIWKPAQLWTGKQIISTVLKNITPSNAEGLNLKARSRVPGHLWGKDSTEDQVVFMDGELVCGVLDTASFGDTDFGLVHSVYEIYGPEAASRLLGILSRLFTKFLQHKSFTCRIDDLALTPDGNAKRAQLLRKGRNIGTEGAIENFPSLANTPKSEIPRTLASLLEDVLHDDRKMAGLDVTVKTKLAGLTKSIADACMPHGLLRKFPHNNMQTMTISGAKGSAVNAQQISCALGQQELEGRRVPVMVSGKSLPSFKAFETRAIAGGYVASRFLTGVKPQEFYFHCMAGREGLIDTAVKTSRSGYLQRCLIKHLEGIRVHYDHTVRGSDSSIYQFHYGGDALDVTRSRHLHQFEFVARNTMSMVNRYRPKSIGGVVDDHEAVNYMKKVLKRSSERPNKNTPAPRDKYLPAMFIYSPSRFLGSTSEKFAEAVGKYIKSNPDKLLESKKNRDSHIKRRHALLPANRFRMLMYFKYMRSLIEPGEAVGLLASQGVGEPSTQMTLNTFHFAGHGAANVTLGIPRLREIVMTASQKPKTPSMTMVVREGVDQSTVDNFCKKASRLTLSQVVDNVTVTERRLTTGEAQRMEFLVHMSFFPEEEYAEEYGTNPSEILSSFAVKFPVLLRKAVATEVAKLDASLKRSMSELGKGKKVATSRTADAGEGGDADEDGEVPSKSKGDDDDDEAGDGDAEDAKRARQRREQATYEPDDEEEPEVEDVAEYGGDDIEAKLPLQDGETLVEPHDEDEDGSPGAQVDGVGSTFERNFPLGDSFEFTSSGCKFRVEFTSGMPKLLLVELIERVCRLTIIREIPGITDCFSSKEKVKGVDGKPDREVVKITTNGSSFSGIWQFANGPVTPIIELDEMYSNDIYAGLKVYGVEMARALIEREIRGVFNAYNIRIDGRHLELIADYMTFEGGYKPFNRKGISTNSSPLLKASYETTAAFLTDAALYGDFDDLTSPSGNIVLGRPNQTGTGVFDVVMPV